MTNVKSIKTQLFPEYLVRAKGRFHGFENLKDPEISTENFSFYTSVSSVFSTKIEYDNLNWGKTLDFLLMLPKSLEL